MVDLNRVERRALVVAALLVVLATMGRVVLTPGREVFAWRPAADTPRDEVRFEALHGRVAVALRREERAHTPLANGERIDPNEAPEEELRRLPGIGPTRARAIAEQRAEEKFRRPDDLLRVAGIGAATLARIAPYLALPETDQAIGVEGPNAVGTRALPRPYRTPAKGCASAGPAPRVDVNRADSAALVSLPGIGPARARSIVRTRSRRGRFEALEDILEVPGIGPHTLKRLRAVVCVG